MFASEEIGAARRMQSFNVTVEFLPEVSTQNIHPAVFNVPIGLEAVLSRNAIQARDSTFSLEVGRRPGTVTSTFYSSDPVATAEAIRARLVIRISDPSPPGADECSIM